MKYCAKCGSLIENGATVCPGCGAPVDEAASQQSANYQQPPYNPNYQQPVNPYYQQQTPMDKDIETGNILGIISLVGSIIGFGIFFIGALVCGIIGMSKIKTYMTGKEFPNEKAKSAYNLGKAGVIICIVKFGLALLIGICWVVFLAIFAGSAASGALSNIL